MKKKDKNKDLDRTRQLRLSRLRWIIRQVKPLGYSPTGLAKAAGIRPSTINRKLSGADRSLIKPETLADVETTASDILGRPLGKGEVLMAELDSTNHEIAHMIDAVIRALVKRGVLREEDFPEDLRRNLERRRHLLEILGLPNT